MGFKALSTVRTGAASTVSKQAATLNTSSGLAVGGAAITSSTTISKDIVTPGQGSNVTPASGIAITSVNYLNANGSISTANAVSTAGGNIKINGTGFTNPMTVIVGSTTISNANVTVANSTAIIASLGSASPGNVNLYAFTSGNTGAVLTNGVYYSGVPTWTTSTVSFQNGAASNVQLVASSDSTLTYTLQAGSTLPTGISLISTGYLSGTATGYSTNTSSSVVIVATDLEGQAAQQTITWTVTVADPQFNYVSLLLNGDTGTNTANAATNNTFLDSSTNNYPVTRAGNTTQGTFSPYSQTGWSNYFDGSGDYLTVPNTGGVFTFSTGNFTIEAWVYMNVLPSGNGYPSSYWILGGGPVNSNPGFDIAIGSTNLQVGLTNFAALNINAAHNMKAGTWYHVAIVRNSNTLTAYINGSSLATADVTGVTPDPMSTGVAISAAEPAGSVSGNFNGFISNLRVVKGTAVYTSTFTPSTTPLTAIANTSLLTCQSNRFIDNSSNALTITRNGDSAIQATSPFAPSTAYTVSANGGSAYFDGNGDNLTYSGAVGPAGTEDFTFEFWWYFASGGVGGSYPRLFETTASSGFQIYLSSGTLVLAQNGGSAIFTYSTSTIINQWAHICITRVSSVMRLFINGVLQGYTASGSPFTASSSYRTFSEGGGPIGYMSDLRVVRGSVVSAYSTAVTTTGTQVFTPPTVPLTAVTNTALLCSFTNGGIVDAHSSCVLETVGDAKLSTVVKKFGNASMYFDGTGDYLYSANSTNFALGAGDFTVEAWVYPTVNGVQGIIATGNGGTVQPFFYINGLAPTWLYNSTGVATGPNVTLNAWNHLAVSRSGTTIRVFTNGVSGTAATPYTDTFTSSGLWVGSNNAGGQTFTGYIDDLRITRGFARYTANFTPSATPFQVQ